MRRAGGSGGHVASRQCHEWRVAVPWGHVAVKSWGDPSKTRVLLVHGTQDSVDTFIPLLELLPDDYYFVGLDLPGHGRSSHFPPGLMLSRLHMLPALCALVDHLEWDKFIYMGHSLGTEIGKYYNAVYPDRITKVIDLDPAPTMLRFQLRRLPLWYQTFYERYYENYNRFNNGYMRPYTREEAGELVMRNRGLTEEQAEVVLRRNLVPLGDDKFGLAWDQRLKLLSTLNIPNDYYLNLVSRHPVPTLVIWASSSYNTSGSTKSLLNGMQETIPDFYIIHVEGSHDVHLTHPERFADRVRDFMERQFVKKSKL